MQTRLVGNLKGVYSLQGHLKKSTALYEMEQHVFIWNKNKNKEGTSENKNAVNII
jgi:hypothetical protein